ncbi:YafY family protein [Nonomuraea sp. NPDC050310]|uniref:helix-turn-helix transcriptional regulator n=1 Tax=unclassified Nonomuraea TaxID=2593643 RepID=UPI0033E2CECA
MRASRLLSLLLLLQARGRMTAPELAAELEVSVRTVYRDVEALSAAGVPVYADRGPAGGYQLLDGFRTRLTGLTADEASGLFLAALPGPAAELGLDRLAANAELKLLSALPPEPRSQAARLRERFHLDVPSWYRSADDVPHLAEVSEAVWGNRPLRMTYRKWGPAEVERVVQPYGLVLKGGSWYLVAAPAGASPRTYRVARILTVETLPGTFEHPPGFDLAAFWQEYSRRFMEQMYTARVLIRLAPDLDALFRYTVGEDVGAAALREASEPDAEGWRVLELPVESLTHARWVLLRLGARVEVLEPPEMRALMTEAAAELHKLYG